MSCGETCSTHGCNQSNGCAAHAYKNNFDQLGNRIAEELTSETYALVLIDALIFTAVIGIVIAVVLWGVL